LVDPDHPHRLSTFHPEENAVSENSRSPVDAGAPEHGQWIILVDPAWRAPAPGVRPPVEAVVGGWLVAADGSYGGFHANAGYLPSNPDSPTDPVDATLRLVARGEAGVDALLAALRDATVAVAIDQHASPVIDQSPDGVPSVLVTTAAVHRHRVRVQEWMDIPTARLGEWLPEQGVDVLLNPGAPTSIRLSAEVFRRAVCGS
jgi:hypothetical protein